MAHSPPMAVPLSSGRPSPRHRVAAEFIGFLRNMPTYVAETVLNAPRHANPRDPACPLPRHPRRHAPGGPLPRIRPSGKTRRPLPDLSLARAGGGAGGHGLVVQRLSRHGQPPGRAGSGDRGDRAARRRRRRHPQHLRHLAAACGARGRARLAARQVGRAAVRLRLHRQPGGDLGGAGSPARLHRLLRRQEPRLDDRRHARRQGRQAGHLAAQRPGRPGGQAGRRPGRRRRS